MVIIISSKKSSRAPAKKSVKQNAAGWDGAAAKDSLFSYAENKDGELDKGKISKFFLKVEDDGKLRGDYSYPVGKVVGGKPSFDEAGLTAAFVAAMGSHTGTEHEEMAKEAAKIMKREFGSDALTDGMKGVLDMKQDASFTTHNGMPVEETVPINDYPSKFGNIRAGDLPDILEAESDGGEIVGTPDEPVDVVIESVDDAEVADDADDAEGAPSESDVFNDERAKMGLLEWASDPVSGKISKQRAMKWFLDVDGGNGQDPDAYRYPVGYVQDGMPQYCVKALDNSWDLASGRKTGVANRNVQKRIVFLKEREGMMLTPDQDEFTTRHMTQNEAFVEDANDVSGVGLVLPEMIRMNEAPAGSHILHEDDKVIDVPVIPMREGVFTGTDGIPTLKKFEHFGKDAHWLEGQPILKGHTAPTELVTYRHNRIGKLMNVSAREDKRDVVAIARYYKDKLTPEDLGRIRSGTPYDGSIAYTTHTSMLDGELNGAKYNAVEDGGYHFYHFAELAHGTGACSTKDGCGFNLNETPSEVKLNYRCKKNADGSFKCPGTLDQATSLKKYDGKDRESAVIKKPDGTFAIVGKDKATGELRMWNASGERNAHAMAATYTNSGEVGMHSQADDINPVKENAAFYADVFKENENYWTAPVRSHLMILNEQLGDLKSRYARTKEPSLKIDIDKMLSDIQRWDNQYKKLNPQQNESGSADVNVLKRYANQKRAARVEYTGEGYEIKLNSRRGGTGLLETEDRAQAYAWAKKFVATGKIPVSMKLNWNCADKDLEENPDIQSKKANK